MMKLIGYGIALALIIMALMNSTKESSEADGVIPEAYQQSLDKAVDLEQSLQDSAQQRLRDIDESSGQSDQQ